MISIQTGHRIELVADHLADAANRLRGILNESMLARRDHYLTWATSQRRTLGATISQRDLDRLVTTRTYWALLSTPSDIGAIAATAEIEARIVDLDTEQAALRSEILRRQHGGRTTIAVLDAHVLMERHAELETIDWHQEIDERESRRVRVVVPIIVIDELDKLKRSQGDMIVRGARVPRRTLARQALRTLSRMFDRPDAIYRADPPPAKPTQFELLMDPPGHERLASPDAEIRDRALSQAAYADRVVLVTFDIGSSLAASFIGLEVARLKDAEEQVDDSSAAGTP
jgi:rRNA-processing protein FCF1